MGDFPDVLNRVIHRFCGLLSGTLVLDVLGENEQVSRRDLAGAEAPQAYPVALFDEEQRAVE
jgi:hypothetical protein